MSKTIVYKTTNELAREWGVSLRTAQKWASEAGIRQIAPGRLLLDDAQARKVYTLMEREGVFEAIRRGVGRPRKAS